MKTGMSLPLPQGTWSDLSESSVRHLDRYLYTDADPDMHKYAQLEAIMNTLLDSELDKFDQATFIQNLLQ